MYSKLQPWSMEDLQKKLVSALSPQFSQRVLRAMKIAIALPKQDHSGHTIYTLQPYPKLDTSYIFVRRLEPELPGTLWVLQYQTGITPSLCPMLCCSDSQRLTEPCKKAAPFLLPPQLTTKQEAKKLCSGLPSSSSSEFTFLYIHIQAAYKRNSSLGVP